MLLFLIATVSLLWAHLAAPRTERNRDAPAGPAAPQSYSYAAE
jgi:hypothetical protein